MTLGKSKKIIALVCIVLLFAAFAVGCGEVDDDFEELENDFEMEDEGLDDGLDDDPGLDDDLGNDF